VSWIVSMAGGELRGAYQVGVMKAFIESGIEFESYHGTSVGALNAAFMGVHDNIAALRAMWLDIKRKDIIKPRFGSILFHTSHFTTKPLKKLLEEILQADPKKPASVTSVNLHTGEVVLTPNGHPDFNRDVLASASMPLIMNEVENEEGEWLFDGGLADIVPVSDIIEEYYPDNLLVILTKPLEPTPWKPNKRGITRAVSILTRVLSIFTHNIMLDDIDICKSDYPDTKIHVIAPAYPLAADLIDFEHDDIVSGMDRGYKDAVKYLETL